MLRIAITKRTAFILAEVLNFPQPDKIEFNPVTGDSLLIWKNDQRSNIKAALSAAADNPDFLMRLVKTYEKETPGETIEAKAMHWINWLHFGFVPVNEPAN